MKSKLFEIIVLMVAGLVFAQSESAPSEPTVAKPAPREHRGFYNSVSFGAAYNWYKNSKEEHDHYNDGYGSDYRNRDVDYFEYYGGTFPVFEFKFGTAFANLIAFHTVFNLGFFTGTMDYGYREYRVFCDADEKCPVQVTEDETKEMESSDGYNFRTYIGFGSTIYPFRDKNSALNGFFLGGSVGYAAFVTLINGGSRDVSFNSGTAFQVELGKDWWMNDHLSIGVSLGYARTGLVWNTVDSHDDDNVISLSFRLTRG
jgi:hypothetical protein